MEFVKVDHILLDRLSSWIQPRVSSPELSGPSLDLRSTRIEFWAWVFRMGGGAETPIIMDWPKCLVPLSVTANDFVRRREGSLFGKSFHCAQSFDTLLLDSTKFHALSEHSRSWVTPPYLTLSEKTVSSIARSVQAEPGQTMFWESSYTPLRKLFCRN